MRAKLGGLGLGVFLLLIIWFFGVSITGWAQSADQPQTASMKVERIVIAGNKHVPRAEILRALPFKVGDTVTVEKIKAGGQRILDMGYFQRVVPDYKKIDKGIKVSYQVVENPVIQEIKIEGNERYQQPLEMFGMKFKIPLTWRLVKTDKILDILKDHGIEKDKILYVKKLKEALQAILNEYQRRGYVLVRIGDVKVGPTLEIKIIEEKIEKIEIEGVGPELTQIAANLINIPLGRPVQLRVLQESFQKINNSIYFERSTPDDLSFSQGSAPDKLILHWRLRERQLLAQPVEIKQIVFTENTVYTTKELQQALGPLPEGPVDNLHLLHALQGVYALYHEHGYTLMDLRNGGLADKTLTVQILEGVVDKIIIKGNKKTKEYVIRKQIKLHPGEVFNEELLRASYLDLQKLGYFQKIDVNLQNVSAGRVDVIFTITEKEKLGNFSGALSYANGGIVGKISISWKNLFGTGQDLSLGYDRGLTGKEQANWHFDYNTTAFFPNYDYFRANIFQKTERGKETVQQQEEKRYTIIRVGGEASLGYPLSTTTELTLSHRYEQFKKFYEDRQNPVSTGITNSITLGLIYDDRDNAEFPTKGSVRSITLEQAGGFSIGVRFTKLEASVVPYISIAKDQVLAFRLYGGLGWELPTQEQFTLGGVQTLRGYPSFHTARFALLNLEYRAKLIEAVDGVLFFDIGLGDHNGRPELGWSLGLEGRVMTPYFGLMRFVFSWPCVEGKINWAPTFEFGFGQMF